MKLTLMGHNMDCNAKKYYEQVKIINQFAVLVIEITTYFGTHTSPSVVEMSIAGSSDASMEGYSS